MIYKMGIALVMMIATLLVPCKDHAIAGFGDVLDTPAAPSALASHVLINGVARAGNRMVCVGQRGIIIYSDDQGKSWGQASVPVSSDLASVCFPTPQKGWAVGHDGVVLNSSDGGVVWTKQIDGWAASRTMLKFYTEHPPADLAGEGEDLANLMKELHRLVREGADKPFLDVWFENETSGFIVGAFNLIFHTDDGGKNWKPWFDRTENPGRLHLYAIRSVGEDLFISGEQGLVMVLDRKEKRFRRLKTPYQGTFFGVTGRPGAVIVFGMRGNAYRSIDKGASWNHIETGIPVGLTGGTVTEDGRIVLVSQAGQVLVSEDGGLNFNAVKVGKPVPAAAVGAFNKDTLLIAGFGGVHVESIN
jgi:photosystem II stability/assembly factor-like uncharacterized protein